ncbi:MAG: hypothetical protein K0S61_3125 [Anaerocolumna sp.]|jgi:hypothetical protein|nr:hypothetical protein [Anaerocolumna sp.]
MNNRILIITFIIASAMMLNGCVNSISNTDQVTPVEKENLESSLGTDDAQAEKESSEVNSSADNEISTIKPEDTEVDYAAIGNDLQALEALFILNNSSTDIDVVNLLGAPENKTEPIVWGADGLEHQTWYYSLKGIELGFIKDEENNKVIFSINLQSPCTLKTSRGIGIGSRKDEVLKAYKNEINPEENGTDASVIVVGSIYGGLVFVLDNDLVASIFIGAAAE